MRITDIIRGILDQVDQEIQQSATVAQPEQGIAVEIPAEEPCPCAQDNEPDMVTIIQQLAGLQTEPNHVNAPDEQIAPIGAAFPGGDDVHSRKNPADIRTNAPSMYPNYQAK